MVTLHATRWGTRLIHPGAFSLLSREGGIYRHRPCPAVLARDVDESSQWE